MVLWGIYGDLLAEKFHLTSVLRSIIFGFLASLFIFSLNSNLPLFIVSLMVIFLERITTEIYKALWRTESQTKYVIPSDWNFDIPQYARRFLAISLEVSLLSLIVFFDVQFNKITGAILAGSLVALGGMLKDAPHEGFYLRKFFRSPIVSIFIGFFLIYFYPHINGKYYLMSLFGMERVICELYKKILNGRIPGKFKIKKLSSRWKSFRPFILPFYFIDLVSLLSLALL